MGGDCGFIQHFRLKGGVGYRLPFQLQNGKPIFRGFWQSAQFGRHGRFVVRAARASELAAGAFEGR